MMKHLIKLAKAKTGPEKRAIAHDELVKVKPQKFNKVHGGKTVDIEIVSVSHEGELLKVIARAFVSGVEVPVDNPLLYKNAPILVPDGTFETQPEGARIANFVENPQEGLRLIVMETLKVTALRQL